MSNLLLNESIQWMEGWWGGSPGFVGLDFVQPSEIPASGCFVEAGDGPIDDADVYGRV